MEKITTMKIKISNTKWLDSIKKRLLLSSRDAALSKIKQTFKNLKLEKEL